MWVCLTLRRDSVEGAGSLGWEPVAWLGVWLPVKSGVLLRAPSY